MRVRKTLEKKIKYRMNRQKGNVFVRSDFDGLGGYDQIGRCLRQLVAKGELVKLGYGLYTRAEKSPLTGRPAPVVGISALVREALEKLNVKQVTSSYETAYNEGRTTQVPTGRIVGVKGRISRRIGYDGRYIDFERAD